MRSGDLLEVIDETSPFYHYIGRMSGVTREGAVLVQFSRRGGPGWTDEVEFDPFQLELANVAGIVEVAA